MMYKRLVFLFLLAVILVSCNTKKLEIENPDLSDKVKAPSLPKFDEETGKTYYEYNKKII